MHGAVSALPGSNLIVFDLDGTLLDSLPDLWAASVRLLEHYGLGTITAASVRAMIGDGAAILVERILAQAGEAAGGIDRAEATAWFVADYTPRAAEQSRLFPGVHEALEQLRIDGWKLAVCTNKPVRAATHVLDSLGLTPWLAAIGGGDSFPVRKPDPGHLLGTIEQASCRAEGAIMVGDHRNDVQAARLAGIASIFALWGYGPAEMGAGSTAQAKTIGEVPAIAAGIRRAKADPATE